MSSHIKAIPTRYKGIIFRSRLEAKWAVFFDEMGFSWTYEPEGYDLDGTWYLPDFWLEESKMFVEIKPKKKKYSSTREPNVRAFDLCSRLASATKHAVFFISGEPRCYRDDNTRFGYVFEYVAHCFLGKYTINHSGFYKWKDVQIDSILGFHSHLYDMDGWVSLYNFLVDKGLAPHFHPKSLIDCDKGYYRKKYNIEHPRYIYGTTLDNVFIQDRYKEGGFLFFEEHEYLIDSDSYERSVNACDVATNYRFGKVA